MDFGVFTRTWAGRLVGVALLALLVIAALGYLGIDLPDFMEGPR